MVIKSTRAISIVFKTITFLLALLTFSIVVLIFSFMYGIKLSNLSFSGINIGELYLKYDKKLFVRVDDLDYQGKILDCNVSVGSDENKFVVDIENFYYQNLEMNFSGKLLLTKEEIEALSAGTKKDLILFDSAVVFDQNLPPVLANKLFLQFKDDINVRFFKPTLDGVKLDNSTIDIVDMANDGVLKIYLDIYNMLDIRVLKVLGNYEVDLPLRQVGGTTHTIVTIDIPFSSDKGIVIKADAKVKNGVVKIGDNNLNIKQTPPNPNSKTKVTVHVELLNNKVIFDEYTFHSDKLYVDYHDKMVEVSSKQNSILQTTQTVASIENLKAKLKDKTLQYKVDIKDKKSNFVAIDGDTNLNKQITKGVVYINHLGYENKASLDGEKLSFKVVHKPIHVVINGDFGVDFGMENNKSKSVDFQNFTLGYQNKTVTLQSDIAQETNLLTLHNITSLDKNTSIGTLFIENYEYEDKARLENQTLKYQVSHTPLIAKLTGDIELLLKDKENNKDKKIKFDNLVARYENNEAVVDANIKESGNFLTLHNVTSLDKNTSSGTLFIENFEYEDKARLENQTLKFNVAHQPLNAHLTGDIKGTLQGKKTILDGLDVVFSNNILNLKTNYQEGNTTAYLTNTTNFDTNLSKGNLHLKSFRFDKYLDLENEFLPYIVDFKDGIKATIPKYLLNYTKDKTNNQKLVVGRLNNLLCKVNYIENKKLQDGTLHLVSGDDFKTTNIIINDLAVDINSTLFRQTEVKNQNDKNTTDTNQTAQDLPKISLKMFNTKVNVDGYDLNSTSIFVNTNKQTIDAKYLPQDENSTIRFKKDGDILTLRTEDLSAKFIENLLKKDMLDGGTFSISVDGNKTNLNGGIYAKDTNIKNVRILNNLITFINTTPAIITPILALPTLFRMGETNFDMTGYPIRDGHVKFDYLYDTKMLTLPSFYTRSKMMDFKGKGYVDIVNEKLEAGIDVIFLKDYSKFFNHIPLLGYIITGDDGNFVTNVDIRGTFEKQEFETHAVKNASEGAVNAIKRTFMTPFRLFDKAKTFVNESNNQEKTEEKSENETTN